VPLFLLNSWKMIAVGEAQTNVSLEQIQVGNWVDLQPETTYEPGKSPLTVGGSETTTLVLQNPRYDGIKIRVYDPRRPLGCMTQITPTGR
jgi:hypothetical protein